MFNFFSFLILIHTRKSSIKKNRNFVISFLIIVLIVIFGIAIYDVFIKVKANLNTKVSLRKKEQFGAGNVSKKQKLMEVCGLPKNYRDTSHCFNDSTHHTCCMLGPEARKYADSSGNPIGTAAKKAFKAHMKRNAKDSDLTPWCTCFGSEVCSFYSKKFNDGTHIKLINNPSMEHKSQKNLLQIAKVFSEIILMLVLMVHQELTKLVNQIKNVKLN